MGIPLEHQRVPVLPTAKLQHATLVFGKKQVPPILVWLSRFAIRLVQLPLMLPLLLMPSAKHVQMDRLVLTVEHVLLVLPLLVLHLVLLTHVPVLPTVVFLPVLLLLQSRKLALPVPWIPVPRNPSYQQVVVIHLNLLVQLLLAVASLLPILPQLDLLPLSWLSLPLLDFKL